MRFKLAGFILLYLSAVAMAQAPAEGEVESLGFDGYYRPNACIPMKLRLRPKIGTPQTYKLAVLQEDMDRDRVMYSRPFTLNGNPEGARLEEKVWVYFLPQPRDLRQAQSAQDLDNIIRIFLCTPNGKQLEQIHILAGTPQLKDLDQTNMFGITRGTRFVLMVCTSQSRAFRTVYEKAHGIAEEVLFQPITVDELPENVVGYQAVDAIVWLNADPTTLKSDTAAAIRDFVRDGKRLVVCQNPQTWQKMLDSPLAEMLPVVPTGVEEEPGLQTLRKLAGLPMPGKPAPAGSIWRTSSGATIDPWEDTAKKQFPIVRATPRGGAFVRLWQAGDTGSPYLARCMYGLGTVTWVAQDFGDPTILSQAKHRHLGWSRIWDKTLDWRNDTVTPDMAGLPNDSRQKENYELVYRDANSRTDLSTALAAGMEAPSTGAAYVALAIIFFIAYWLLAGPGAYFFLLSKKKAHYSWVAFAASALAATVVTVLLVRLILRGPPELYHVTFVRVNADQEAVINSQFGLYVKSDGLQHIELKETEPKRASYVLPYPKHPDHFVGESSGFTAYLEYEVAMRDRSSGETPAVDVPYRSTIKKLEARWIGRFPRGIEGRASLNDRGLAGRLRNNTGRDLHKVFMIYQPTADSEDDMTIFIPDTVEGAAWPQGQQLDLAEIYSRTVVDTRSWRDPPARGQAGIRGFLNLGWMARDVWGRDFVNRLGDGNYEDADRAALLLSIYDRIKPPAAERRSEGPNNRYELLRRSARELDASGAISSGNLLIFAQSEPGSPLPFPLEVEGRNVPGKGTVYYQFIVPMERSGAATQPSDSGETPETPSEATAQP
ncbi:MAG: hypothetical protein ACM359_22275 [Bacillota bacterium]